MPPADVHALVHQSPRFNENVADSAVKPSYIGPIALAVIVLVGCTLTFLARYLLHRRRLRLAQKPSPSDAASSDAHGVGGSGRARLSGTSTPRTTDHDGGPSNGGTASDFDLDSWRVESGGEFGSLQLRKPPNVASTRSFASLRGSVGSRMLASLCLAEDDTVQANSVCPICLSALRRGVRQAPCGHKYHGGCIRSWIAKVHDWHCPLCVAGCGMNAVNAGRVSVAVKGVIPAGRVSPVTRGGGLR